MGGFKKTLGIIGGLGLIGSTLGYFRYKQRLTENSSITPKEFHFKQEKEINNILSDNDLFLSSNKTLYQYSTCPFCGKLKAFLDYHKIEYNTIEVNPLSKKQISSNGYHKVPQLQLGDNGPILVDSNEIVKLLKPLLDKESPELTEEEQKWVDWASTTLVRYMVINTNRTLKESREGYDYVSNIVNFSGTDKIILELVGGPTMYLVSKLIIKNKLKKTSGYDGGDERTALYKEINNWVENGLHDQLFHGGNNPDIADIDVYGIIQSQRFLPVFKDLRENTNPKFSKWIDNMDNLMPEHYKY